MRLCWLLLLVGLLSSTTVHAQQPFHRSFTSYGIPEVVQHIPAWAGYATLLNGSCRGDLKLVGEQGEMLEEWDLAGFYGAELAQYADSLFVFGAVITDDVGMPYLSYKRVSLANKQMNSSLYHLPTILEDSVEINVNHIDKEDYRGHAHKDSVLVLGYDNHLFRFNVHIHRYTNHRQVAERVAALFWVGDSLGYATASGIWKASATLENPRRVSDSVYTKLTMADGKLYAQQSMQWFVLDTVSWLPVQQADVSADIHELVSWDIQAEMLTVLGKAADGTQRILLLDAQTLAHTATYDTPPAGGTFATATAQGVAFVEPRALYVSDAVGVWDVPKQHVALEDYTADALSYRYVTWREPLQTSLWVVLVRYTLTLRNLGPDSLRYLDVVSQAPGINCSPGQLIHPQSNLSVATGDTFQVILDISLERNHIEEGTPSDIPRNFSLRNPNHELSAAGVDTHHSLVFNYTARAPGSLGDERMRLSPNPATDIVRVDLPQGVPQVDYHICNLQGRALLRGTVGAAEPISLASLSAGTYLMTLRTANRAAQVVRLLKQ